MIFILTICHLNIFFGQDKQQHPQNTPLTRYVDKLNANKLLIPV
jgi:hypothetical protein